jgi:nitroreductase
MSAAVGVDLREHALQIVTTAGLAPSHHNAQPWLFRVRRDAVEVYADRSRLLPVSDPGGRQLLIGVGAAAYAVRLELAELGLAVAVDLLPEPAEPDLAVRVRVSGRHQTTAAERELWRQIPRRRTIRDRLLPEVPAAVRRALANHAAAEGCGLRWLEDPLERRRVATLVWVAERAQQQDPSFIAELAGWVDAEAVAAGQGIPTHALGLSGHAGHAAEFAMRDFTGGHGRLDAPRPEARPVVAVLSSPDDEPADWLRSGQALMRPLLAARAEGIAASYLNQPLERAGLRAELRSELELAGFPQLVLRWGRPGWDWPPATPRRPAATLLRA